MVITGVLAIVILGLVQTFLTCSLLADLASRKTISLEQAQDKLEEILNSNFDTIVTDYASGATPGDQFNLTTISGKGVITASTYATNVVSVDVVVCFQLRNGRIIGEDKNLNGTLDAGEDANGNGAMDSPVKLSTYIRKG